MGITKRLSQEKARTMTFDHIENHYCFITGKHIPVDAPCRFTEQFDAWVSEEGQNIVYASSPSNEEHTIILKEWLDQDQDSREVMDEFP